MKVDIEIPNKDVNIKGIRTQTGQIDTYTRQEIDDKDTATLNNANEYSDEKKVEAIEAAGEYTGEVSLRLASNLLLSVTPLTYILTVTLLNEEEEELDSKSIDLPLEEMIVSIDYDEETKEIIFELKSGEVRRVPVGDIVSGLVDIDTFNAVVEELESIINNKEDKTVITTDDTSSIVTVLVQNNREYRYTRDLVSLTINTPLNTDFISGIVFRSGATPTQILIDPLVKWSGTDVDIDTNTFTPDSDKTYNIVLWYDGININAVSRGV